MEGGISEPKTIFSEVGSTGPREVHLGTPRGWIEHGAALGFGEKGGRGVERATKQGHENPVRMKPGRSPCAELESGPQPEAGAGVSV